MTYKVTTYGTVYRSNGATYGVKGEISGLTRDDVKSQIMYHKERGDGMLVTNEDGYNVPLADFS